MAIIFVYDKNDLLANDIVDATYKHFSFDYTNRFSSELGIEINLYDKDSFPSADYLDHNKPFESDVIVFLISYAFFECPSEYIQLYYDLKRCGANLLAVSLCEQGHLLLNDINVLMFPFPAQVEMEEQAKWKREAFIYKVLCIIARKFIRKRVTLFLSYYREEGTEICKAIKEHLLDFPLYAEWMDIKEIDFSEEIQKRIARRIPHSLMMCVSTEKYSERYWCTVEVLNAKKADIPMIVLDCVQQHENRRSPFSTNIPVVRFNPEIQEKDVAYALLILMKEYLKKLLLGKSNQKPNKEYYLWHSPEPSKIAEIKQKYPRVSRFIYPAPPIALCEANYYRSIFKGCHFHLDNDLQKMLALNNGKKISLSVSDYQSNKTLHKDFLNCLVKEIIRYLIYGNYGIVYGGDWRKNGYTQFIRDYLRAYQRQYIDFKSKFVNYYANIENKNTSEIKHNVYPGEVIFFDLDTIVSKEDAVGVTLTKMRQSMINTVNIVIAVGGNLTSEKGFVSGVAEEIALAIQCDKPFYLIGAPGGATEMIINKLMGGNDVFLSKKTSTAAANVCQMVNTTLQNFSLEKLSQLNQLSPDENKILFYSRDIKEIIRTLFNGILRIR